MKWHAPLKGIAKRIHSSLEKEGIRITLGGEPTFIPVEPTGNEWHFEAVGPTKLAYARQLADDLTARRFAGSAVFFCPGKQYPGEVNPRWAIRILYQTGRTRLRNPTGGTSADPHHFARALASILGVPNHWVEFADPRAPGSTVLAIPLDGQNGKWISRRWTIPRKARLLSKADGPAGLRLPLELLPERVAPRLLVIEWKGERPAVFFPPLLPADFLRLLEAVDEANRLADSPCPDLEGYVPGDSGGLWETLGIAADPGVLEINLPVCRSWTEYDTLIRLITASARRCGLRPVRPGVDDHEEGTGGGNHLLLGGESTESNPFFQRPRLLASLLRIFQSHPSLSYLFTGKYVGSSSQAPRPDESGRPLEDLEMAYSFLESLPPGDHREMIGETMRHLHVDMSGNSHRSEVSFDKFWNPSWPNGTLGLIEFRAFESLPRAEWSSALALLVLAICQLANSRRRPKRLTDFGRDLHDRYFLPTFLWHDFETLLTEIKTTTEGLPEAPFLEIWNWRFPVIWQSEGLTIRKACEGWPLLSETPVVGGTTSRFVDSSLRRLEFQCPAEWATMHDIYVAGRQLKLRRFHDRALRGLRFRASRLHPSLHPGIAPHTPLHVAVIQKSTGLVVSSCEISERHARTTKRPAKLGGSPCRGPRQTDWTADLRLA